MDNREELKHYIQELQEQYKARESKNGITLWGIGAGIIYISWQILSKIAALQQIQDFAQETMELISIISSIIACSLILAIDYSQNSQNTFDYRISPNYKNITVTTNIAIILAPVIASCFAYAYLIDSSKTAFYQKLSGYAFLALFSLIAAAEISIAIKKNMPDASAISNSRTDLPTTISLLCTAFFFASMGGIGVWKIVDGVISNHFSQTCIEVAFNICLIPACIFIAKSIRNSNQKSTNLSKLQRDIYIHNISTGEIENRLKEEFIGFQFDEWLQSEISKIQQKTEAFSKIVQNYDNTREAITSIPSNLKYEIDGHKREYSENLYRSFTEYRNEFSTLTSWIDKTLKNNVKKDPYLKSRLTEIRETLEKIDKKNYNTLEEIANDLNSLHANTKDLLEEGN